MKTPLLTFVGLVVFSLLLSPQQGFAQENDPIAIAIFPFKNLHNDVEFNGISWEYADSLEAVLNRSAGAGVLFELIANEDVRDQLLAQNVDITSPSYETDVWTIAEALEADRMVWGTYFTKYGKVFLKVEVIDLSINMPDPDNVGTSKGLLYENAVSSVYDVAKAIMPALGPIE